MDLIGSLIVYGIHLFAALIVFLLFLIPLSVFGEREKFLNAGIQAVRWLTAGVVAGVVVDTVNSGPAFRVFIPGSMAIGVLMVVEYHMLSQLEKAEEL